MRRRMRRGVKRVRNVAGSNGFVSELDLSRNRGWWTCRGYDIFVVRVQRKNALVAMAWRGGWRRCRGSIVGIDNAFNGIRNIKRNKLHF